MRRCSSRRLPRSPHATLPIEADGYLPDVSMNLAGAFRRVAEPQAHCGPVPSGLAVGLRASSQCMVLPRKIERFLRHIDSGSSKLDPVCNPPDPMALCSPSSDYFQLRFGQRHRLAQSVQRHSKCVAMLSMAQDRRAKIRGSNLGELRLLHHFRKPELRREK